MQNKANPTTGMTGALCAAVTVFICGMSPVHWSFLMAVTAGLGLFWMASWPPCTPVAVLKGDQTLQVSIPYFFILGKQKNYIDHATFLFSCGP